METDNSSFRTSKTKFRTFLLLPLILTICNFAQISYSEQLENHSVLVTEDLKVDPKGYITYCPCMGRFGNQADQFLGALAFAKGLDRTLILPPWIEYIPYQAGSLQVPFKTYFNVSILADYHRVIPMELFMEQLASSIWPPENRISFCYQARRNSEGCDAKDGNPFGPFWDRFNIDFIKSEFFGPDLHYTSYSPRNDSWGRYDPRNWPVLAFVGPPSMFPVEGKNVHLQEYLKWSTSIEEKANDFIAKLPRGPFIGIHLRNGMDWSRACDLVKDSTTLFSSQQCTGYRNEYGSLNPEMCFPSPSTIIKQVKRGVRKIKATSVFVAADSNHMISELSKELKGLGATVHKLPYESPHVDLAILGQSNLWIGNCVSSFSAFVKRERDVNGFPSEFWAFPTEKSSRKNKKTNHEEL